MRLSKIIKSVYDATSDSTSSFGKFGRWAFPFNAQYWLRDAWRKYGSRPVNSAGSMSSYGSDIYGPTGSIIGRY